MSTKANAMFREKFNGQPNFITPTLIERGMCRDHMAYEISVGRGIRGNDLYGVTFVGYDGNGDLTSYYDENGCVESLAAARRKVAAMTEGATK